MSEKTFVSEQKVDMFLQMNKRYFPAGKLTLLKEGLSTMSEAKFSMVSATTLLDPSIALGVSIVGGILGLDRFFIGDVGAGIFKLFTCGCCGIMALLDWFSISNMTREKNFQTLMMLI